MGLPKTPKGVHNTRVPQRATMQSAQLHPNIRYVSLNDEAGVFGLLIHHDEEHIYAAVEVESLESFREVYEEMVALRRVRDSLTAV